MSAKAARSRNEAMLMKIPGVVGVGVGLTEKGNRAAIHVFVEHHQQIHHPTTRS